MSRKNDNNNIPPLGDVLVGPSNIVECWVTMTRYGCGHHVPRPEHTWWTQGCEQFTVLLELEERVDGTLVEALYTYEVDLGTEETGEKISYHEHVRGLRAYELWEETYCATCEQAMADAHDDSDDALFEKQERQAEWIDRMESRSER